MKNIGNKNGLIDGALAFGSGFDWITPVASIVGNAISEREHYTLHVSWAAPVQNAAYALNVNLYNQTISGNWYQFDCSPGDWDTIAQRLGWQNG